MTLPPLDTNLIASLHRMSRDQLIDWIAEQYGAIGLPHHGSMLKQPPPELLPSAEAMAGGGDRSRILAELNANSALIFEFTKAWYKSPFTFQSMSIFGTSICKMPTDLWVVLELMNQFQPKTVIETGTAYGGSALWFALLMDILDIEQGRVLTIDPYDAPDGKPRPPHPRISYLKADSAAIATRDAVAMQAIQPVLVNLDSDHHAEHVERELDLYAPLVPQGGWLIVEDTNGAPVEIADGQVLETEGPMQALERYLSRHPGEFQREVVCERFWLTMNPGGFLQRVAFPLAAK